MLPSFDWERWCCLGLKCLQGLKTGIHLGSLELWVLFGLGVVRILSTGLENRNPSWNPESCLGWQGLKARIPF